MLAYTINNMILKYQKEDFRSACIFDDVNNLSLTDIKIPTIKTYPVMVFKNVIAPLVKECKYLVIKKKKSFK